MTALTFHPPTPAALDYLAAHLRAGDLRELAVTSPGDAPREVLARCVADSRWTIVACVDGRPAVIYGVAPTDHPDVGSCWMLATPDMARIRRPFIERCRAEVRLMQQHYVALANQVHRDNAASIRWLEWLGFTVDRNHPTGPDGQLFNFWKGPVHV
jgi:hypothetical protein